MSVYDVTYKTLGRTYPVIYTAVEMGWYSPSNKWTELERNFSLTLSSINPERSLENHKIFHPRKLLKKQDVVIWYKHIVTFTHIREEMVAYTSRTPLLAYNRLLDTTIITEAWLVIISCNVGGHNRFLIITQVGIVLRWTHKLKSLIYNKVDLILRGKHIMGKIIALNLNQILFVGILSISDEKHNTMNITWNAQGWKTGIFVGIRETISPDWSCIVTTQVTGIPFGFFWSKLKKREPHIGYMEILLYQSKGSIAPNVAMIQLSNISCGGTHQSWS